MSLSASARSMRSRRRVRAWAIAPTTLLPKAFPNASTRIDVVSILPAMTLRTSGLVMALAARPMKLEFVNEVALPPT